MRASIETAESLSHLQARFSRKLIQRGGAEPGELTRSKRFRVHRNNVFASLIGALRGRYPVIERLVGEDFFEAAAGHFIEAHPPRSPMLIDYGEGFSAFLESFEPRARCPIWPMSRASNGCGTGPITLRTAKRWHHPISPARLPIELLRSPLSSTLRLRLSFPPIRS